MMHTTPIKTASPNGAPLSSPRLRSPRGATPRHAGGLLFNLLKHSKGVLVTVAIAVIWLVRPSMDPGSNLSTFVDSSGAPFDFVQFNASSFTSPDMKTPTIEQPNVDTPESPPKPKIPKSSSSSSSTSSLLSSYDSSRRPLIALPKQKSSQLLIAPMPAVDVHLIVDVSGSGSVGPQSKFLLDGLERSPFTNMVGMTFLNPTMQQVQIGERGTRPMVYMVDWGSMQRDCHRLQRVLDALQRTKDEYVLLVDYTGSTRQSTCEAYFEKDTRVRLAKRSIVSNRHYDHLKKTIDPGKVSDNTGHVMQAPLVVRERFVAALRNNTREQNPMRSTRRVDVCFFWKPGDYSHYGFWRRDVSKFLERLGKSSPYSTLVDVLANDVEGMEMGNIQLKYVNALLHCKIVVIAQRDEWEDHYRLYESLASGALVMTDPMLAPPEGLKNKTNILIYDSLESLEQMIRYYLEQSSRRKSVARRGMELALGRYRSWHRVEQLLFGQPLFQVDAPLEDPPEKMTRPQISLVDGEIALTT